MVFEVLGFEKIRYRIWSKTDDERFVELNSIIIPRSEYPLYTNKQAFTINIQRSWTKHRKIQVLHKLTIRPWTWSQQYKVLPSLLIQPNDKRGQHWGTDAKIFTQSERSKCQQMDSGIEGDNILEDCRTML